MGTWLLFVDESGDFSAPHDDVLVAGWLVRAYDTAQLRAVLRRQLEQCHPQLRYPPHATDLRIPAARAAMCELAGEPSSDAARAVLDACAPALAALTRWRDPTVDRWRTALADGRLPDRADLVRVDAWLARNAPAAYGSLRRLRDDEHSRRVLLHQALGGSLDATSFTVGAFARGGDQRPGGARYLDLLTMVFERAASLIARDGSDFVWAHVATRDLESGTGARTPLQLKDLVKSAERAKAALGPLVAGLSLQFHSPSRYGPEVHPGLVVADAVANRLRDWARRVENWQTFREAALQDLGLSIEATTARACSNSSLPTVAAAGLPRDVVTRGFRGETPEGFDAALAGERPAWAREQALAWLRATREWA